MRLTAEMLENAWCDAACAVRVIIIPRRMPLTAARSQSGAASARVQMAYRRPTSARRWHSANMVFKGPAFQYALPYPAVVCARLTRSRIFAYKPSLLNVSASATGVLR